jgi:RNA polymerase sigma factor (sigma-70 family)
MADDVATGFHSRRRRRDDGASRRGGESAVVTMGTGKVVGHADNGTGASAATRRVNGRTANGRRVDGSSRREPADLMVLVTAAQQGSQAAFEQIYRSLAGAVVAYLRWRRVSDPDGLTNEIFAQVHRKLASFQGDEQGFRSWVFTIAHHRTVDDHRRNARQVLVDTSSDVEDSPNVPGAVTGDVEQEAFAALGSERVRQLLSVLSPDQRSVLLLRVVADLSVEDAASVLGKRAGAVKALQHRAVATLRRHLAVETANAWD